MTIRGPKLTDGYNKPVKATKSAVRDALARTDLVHWEEWNVSISKFYSTAGDELDVYDGRQTYDPQVIFEPTEVDEAVDEFFSIIQDILSQGNR